MAISILYAGANADTGTIFSYIDVWAGKLDVWAGKLKVSPLQINPNAIYGIAQLINDGVKFPHNDGLNSASPFKKAACFAVNFIAAKPILEPFQKRHADKLTEIKNHQNAIVAYNMAVDALYNASIKKTNGTEYLKNKINISRHSYVDIIEALASVTPQDHFQLVSVLLEQLAYRANPEASYNLSI